jgi:hypothetical protein
MLTCDCIDCMVDGVGIELEDQIKYMNYHKKNNRKGLDAFLD